MNFDSVFIDTPLMNTINEINENNEINDINENNVINNINDTSDVNNYIDQSTRYENIIQLLGLNISIDYPIKIIIEGIIDMHIIKPGNISNRVGRYARIYKFRDNNISKKLSLNIMGDMDAGNFSTMTILHSLKRIHRQYKYNKMVVKIDDTTNNTIVESKGFNNENPRWTKLTSIFI